MEREGKETGEKRRRWEAEERQSGRNGGRNARREKKVQREDTKGRNKGGGKTRGEVDGMEKEGNETEGDGCRKSKRKEWKGKIRKKKYDKRRGWEGKGKK